MNKIILNIGLLVFFLSIIFFTRLGLPIIDIIFRSFLVFAFVTFMLGILALLFVKSINKISYDKQKEIN